MVVNQAKITQNCLYIFIGLFIQSSLIVYPALSHSGHIHHSPQTESTSKSEISEENNTNTLKESPSTSESNAETSLPITNIEKANLSSYYLIPKPSEILFLLLIINPFLLYALKRKLYHS